MTTTTPFNRTIKTLAAAAALAFGASAPAFAGTTTVRFGGDNGTAKVGSYTGTANYDDASDMLTIVLQNTTTAPGGAAITGVAFNVKGAATASYADGDNLATKKVDEDAFDDARGKSKKPKLIKAKPVGSFEAGAALDGKFAKKSKIGRGAAAGTNQAFTFHISGPGAGSLTAADFFTDGAPLVVSFGGFGKKGKGVDLVSSRLLPVEFTNGQTSGTTTGGDLDRPVTPGVVVPPPHTTSTGGGTGHPLPPGPIFPLPKVIDPGTGTGTGGSGANVGGGNGAGPTAVPLPPAAWMALGTFGLAGVGNLRRRLNAWRSE